LLGAVTTGTGGLSALRVGCLCALRTGDGHLDVNRRGGKGARKRHGWLLLLLLLVVLLLLRMQIGLLRREGGALLIILAVRILHDTLDVGQERNKRQ